MATYYDFGGWISATYLPTYLFIYIFNIYDLLAYLPTFNYIFGQTFKNLRICWKKIIFENFVVQFDQLNGSPFN
jgi:hypothetical protein